MEKYTPSKINKKGTGIAILVSDIQGRKCHKTPKETLLHC